MFNLISSQKLEDFIAIALKEDIGDGDHTSLATIPQGQTGKAKLLVKDDGIIAGVELALRIFHKVDQELYVDVIMPDGFKVSPGDTVLVVQGNVQAILKAERLVLNCMQRMSGIATQTKNICHRIRHTSAKVLDTRKTTPGFRLMEKWAVEIGGGTNHRFGLYDVILIKDNHVDYAGGILPALQAVRDYLARTQKKLKVIIEVRNLLELEEALSDQLPQRILLDNFTVSDLRRAVIRVEGRVETEASGSITASNAAAFAETGVDYISMGALTHSVKNMDLSLKACQ